MNFPRKLGLILMLAAGLATAGHFLGIELPTLRWLYGFSMPASKIEAKPWLDHWDTGVGIALSALLAAVGVSLLVRSRGFHWNPLTLRKLERFRSIGRGYVSYRVLLLLVFLAMLDQALVGKRALVVRNEGKWFFPAFVEAPYQAKDFGMEGDGEPDYRAMRKAAKDTGMLVVMPPVPWDPTFDSDEVMERPLVSEDGRLFEEGKRRPYQGFAYAYHPEDPGRLLRKVSLRNGLPQGSAEVIGEGGETIGRETWERGVRVATTVPESRAVPEEARWVRRIYMPLPPSVERGHLLGTDSKGWDLLAQLYGGLQVALKASGLFLLLVYGAGITLGCLMGYFGGVFDLVMQRVMEVFSNVPFLLVVMIITANIGLENIDLGTIVVVFSLFSWISVAIYLRTSTYKEKERDYASAARVLGAGTGRVIFRHILPNAIATIVTLVPFSVSSVVASLTALDFLGFGVPERYPSWGRILNDGLSNLGSPWIVSSVFVMLVLVLLLITFIGEAVREAFDPKKFTTYQ